ncbi:hypothetical protein RF55_13776, partial [Lasius niger]
MENIYDWVTDTTRNVRMLPKEETPRVHARGLSETLESRPTSPRGHGRGFLRKPRPIGNIRNTDGANDIHHERTSDVPHPRSSGRGLEARRSSPEYLSERLRTLGRGST